MTPEQIVEFAEGLARVAASGGGPKALAAYLAEATGSGVTIDDGGALSVAGASRIDPHALRLTAAAIGVEFARDGGRGRGRRHTFWERLLAGAYHDAAAARDDAAAHGVTVAASYVAIALEPEPFEDGQAPPDPSDLRAIAGDAFRGGASDLGFFERGATLLVFVPVAREIDASNARTAAALLPKSALKRDVPTRISGGAGTVEPLLDLPLSAQRAQAALAIARRIHGPGHAAAYDDLGAYPLLYEGSDAARLRAFARATLAPLRAYDDKHATELERTLKLYFDVGENVKTAAARLNVHRHTVFYRLRQIGEICAVSLESPGDQLTLRLAVAIDALHSQ